MGGGWSNFGSLLFFCGLEKGRRVLSLISGIIIYDLTDDVIFSFISSISFHSMAGALLHTSCMHPHCLINAFVNVVGLM